MLRAHALLKLPCRVTPDRRTIGLAGIRAARHMAAFRPRGPGGPGCSSPRAFRLAALSAQEVERTSESTHAIAGQHVHRGRTAE